MTQEHEIVEYAELVEAEPQGKTLPYRVTGYSSPLPIARTTSWSKQAIFAGVAGALVFFTAGLSSVPAIVLGHLALRTVRRRGMRGRNSAILGLVLGYGTLVVVAAIIALSLSLSHPI